LKSALRVAVDGAELAADIDRGPPGRTKAPLVLLHAGVADGRMWDGVFEWAGRSRAVLRYDRRGFGASMIERAAPHRHVADLWAVLEAAGLERVVLMGCSQGGRIALDAALEAPQRVAALALVAPAVTGAPEEALDAATLRLAEAIEAAEAARDLDAMNRLEAHLWLDGRAAPEGRVAGAARECFLAMNAIALHSPPAGEPIEAPSDWDRLEEVACPTLVVCGDLDLPILVQRCEVLAARIPAACHVALQGLAHLPSLEAPERFIAAVAPLFDAID
jgi:pimeloyl-ACP methyl ester carboxylesterase